MSLAPEPTATDWRCGAVVYQLLVDRFAPPDDLDARRDHHAPPRRIRAWSERPTRGRPTALDPAWPGDDTASAPTHGVWSHELDFWGGTLDGVRERLDHLQRLGVDVLALGPLYPAGTNHRYDPWAWNAVAPELGGEAALDRLVAACEARGMAVMLDGVFNHMGRGAPAFRSALIRARQADALDGSNDPLSPADPRRRFHFDAAAEHGYRAWFDVANLPEVDLECGAVQRELWGAPDAVVPAALRRGVAGWRLDVAHDIGPRHLQALRAAAHSARPNAWIVGEVWNDPEGWLDVLDGVLNMHWRRLILATVSGELAPAHAGRLFARTIETCGVEPLLRSWLVLDNHDTERLASAFERVRERRMARVLQLTLPGSPVLYYGSEVAMTGAGDPANRAPMDWERVAGEHAELKRVEALLAMRRASPALRTGECRFLDTDSVLAFVRRTPDVAETRVVVANPSDAPVTERLVLREPRLMTGTPMRDLLVERERGHARTVVGACDCGTLPVTVPALGVRVLAPEMPPEGGGAYSPFRGLD